MQMQMLLDFIQLWSKQGKQPRDVDRIGPNDDPLGAKKGKNEIKP
jgi:hypothetical protein